jgi:hypothetical protein
MARSRAAALAGALVASSVWVVAPAFAQSPPPAPETIALGDWQLAPALEVRTRGEYARDPVDVGGGVDSTGAAAPRVRNAGGILERSRLGIGADRGPLHVQLTLQDARAWGVPSPTATLGAGGGGDASDGRLASFGAYEAFLEVHSSAARPSFVRVGRQAVVWGDGRLLGNADWSPTARTLDAARAHLSLGAFDFELLATVLATAHPIGSAFGDASGFAQGGAQLYAAQVAWTLDPLFVAQGFAFAKVARTGGGGSDLSRGFGSARSEGETYTGALRIGGDSKGWRYALEGAYQIGNATRIGASGADRRAYAAAAYIQKALERVALTPTVRLGAAYASGDDGSGDYKQFDPILPDVHAFHGAMDIFAWSNVVEGNARVTAQPWSNATLGVEYRYAHLQDAKGEWLNAYLVGVGRAAANTSTELGHELDAFVLWAPLPSLDIVLGYSAFLAGDGARTILAAQARGSLQSNGTYAPSDLTHYGYLQATVRVP